MHPSRSWESQFCSCQFISILPSTPCHGLMILERWNWKIEKKMCWEIVVSAHHQIWLVWHHSPYLQHAVAEIKRRTNGRASYLIMNSTVDRAPVVAAEIAASLNQLRWYKGFFLFRSFQTRLCDLFCVWCCWNMRSISSAREDYLEENCFFLLLVLFTHLASLFSPTSV